MDVGVHLPLMELGDEGQSLDRLRDTAVAARHGGFAALSANDHFLFSTPWLDGPTALAASIEHSGEMELATTISLVSLRGAVPLAKSLAAIDLLSGGRLIAGVGPGSSKLDYDVVGVPYDDRWPRFEDAVKELRRSLETLRPAPAAAGGVPIWIGSWGSAAGLRRVARLADGWLASAYNTTPEAFATGRATLGDELASRGRERDGFPCALATMWTWVTEDRSEADRVLRDTLAPLLRRDPEELGERVCVGGAGRCTELLGRYRDSGCDRVYVWPLGDERRQLERIAGAILPELA
jgi:alkanesulfonate monooxygenase SsuD/methylene tetrahydromethanopterin reductase-like flavin-dependent oxidoreductase (luciferase family)